MAILSYQDLQIATGVDLPEEQLLGELPKIRPAKQSDRAIQCLILRYGLSGNRSHTLQEIADTFSVTPTAIRNSLRQLQQQIFDYYRCDHRGLLLRYYTLYSYTGERWVLLGHNYMPGMQKVRVFKADINIRGDGEQAREDHEDLYVDVGVTDRYRWRNNQWEPKPPVDCSDQAPSELYRGLTVDTELQILGTLLGLVKIYPGNTLVHQHIQYFMDRHYQTVEGIPDTYKQHKAMSYKLLFAYKQYIPVIPDCITIPSTLDLIPHIQQETPMAVNNDEPVNPVQQAIQKEFNYEQAFSRTLGWVTEAELQRLRSTRIAIAGLGGVGGDHLLTLVRLGIGRFNISDLDMFEMANFNRQAGAAMSTLGQLKCFKLEDMAKDINPELHINTFPSGINLENIDDFLYGVDVYVDCLDLFAIEIREAIFKACEQRKIPVISAAPLGMGTSMICFKPGSMSYKRYFGWTNQEPLEKVMMFLVGLSPRPTVLKYIVDKTRIKLLNKKAPSTPMGIDLAAGVLCTNVLKLILQRGHVVTAPRTLHFDAYLNTFRVLYRPLGFYNPLQRLALWYVKRKCS